MPEPWCLKTAERHLRVVLRKHDIQYDWLKGPQWHNDANSNPLTMRVWIPHPHNARQYLVALHEIGHLLGPFRTRDDYHEITTGEFHLICEASAWGWAMEHISEELDARITQKDVEETVGRGFWHHAWHVANYAGGS